MYYLYLRTKNYVQNLAKKLTVKNFKDGIGNDIKDLINDE